MFIIKMTTLLHNDYWATLMLVSIHNLAMATTCQVILTHPLIIHNTIMQHGEQTTRLGVPSLKILLLKYIKIRVDTLSNF